MGSPIDRTSKAALDSNLVDGETSDAPKVKNNNDVLYNYVDGLNNAIEAHADAATLPHPDGSVTGPKLKDGSVTTPKLADGAVTSPKIANSAVGANQLDPALLNNWGDIAIQAEFDRRGINIMKYGAKGDGVTDDTAAIQAAINAADRGVLVFPSTGKYKVGKLFVTKSVVIQGNGATLLGTDNAIFCVNTDLDYLVIDRFNATFPGVTGNQGREFFVNTSVDGSIGNNTTNFEDGTQYNIKRLEITNNDLTFCKVSIYGTDTIPLVEGNTWKHNSTVSAAPAYLRISKGEVAVKTNEAYVLRNHFDVYPPNSSNIDIVKIGNGSQAVQFAHNWIKNNNPNSFAQVDVFTGGDRMRFESNTLINVQFHRKQVKGEIGGAPIIHFDRIVNNHVEIENGHTLETAFYLVGSLFSAVGNTVKSSNTSKIQYAFYLDNSDISYDSFGTDSGAAFKLIDNTVDFRFAHASSIFMQYDTGALTAVGLGIVSLNLFLGGSRFVSGVPKAISGIGNVWGNSAGATGTSFFNSTSPSIAIGNLADSAAPIILSQTRGNSATASIPAINTASDTTPSVNNASIYNVSGGGTVTNFDDGYAGQSITLIASGGGCTIQHNSNVMLNGSTNFVMVARSSLTLIKFSDGTWQEVSRKTP